MGSRGVSGRDTATMPAVGACCEYLEDFSMHMDEHGDNIVNNEAAVFISIKGKMYIYRSKDGDWVVGTTVGNNKKGVHLRSQDPDRSEYIHECPCQTKVWQKLSEEKWVTDKTIRVMIRQAQVLI